MVHIDRTPKLLALTLLTACSSATQDLGESGALREKLEAVHAVSSAIGYEHGCVLTDKGAVKCWGQGDTPALGNSDPQYDGPEGPGFGYAVPVVGLSQDVVSIASSRESACAITSTGALRCWGTNSWGELGLDPSGENAADTIPTFPEPTIVAGLSAGVAHVSMSYFRTCATTTEGRVKCWGVLDGYEARSPVPVDIEGLTGIVSVATDGELGGQSVNFALSTTGGVQLFYADNRVPPYALPGFERDVVAITKRCLLTRQGRVTCWSGSVSEASAVATTGRLTFTEVPGLDSVVAIASAEDHSCALTAAGGVKCWGAISWGGVVIDADWHNGHTTAPVDVPGLETGIVSISVFDQKTCGVRDTGGVACVSSCFATDCNLRPSDIRPSW